MTPQCRVTLSPGNFLTLFNVRFNVCARVCMYFYGMYLQELFHHRISIHEFVLNFARSPFLIIYPEYRKQEMIHTLVVGKHCPL